MTTQLTIDSDKLLDATPDAIVLVDSDGKIGLINSQAELLFGYSRSGIIGKEIEILIPTAISAKHKAIRDEYSKNPHVRPMGIGLGLTAVDREGRKFPVEISLSPYRQGDKTYTIAIIRDATEIRKIERELRNRAKEVERSNSDLEQFAMIASHDLQIPLQQLVSYCQVLDEECSGALGNDGRGYTKIIRKASERMQEQISGLLEYSRVSAAGQKLGRVDLAVVLKQVCANLEVEIEMSRAKIESPEILPTIHGDTSKFTLVFQNLISNAIRYRRPECALEITVRANRADKAWNFSVEDNGVGILANEREAIFEMFHRSASHRENHGMGIGLAVCKKIIRQLEGTIWVAADYTQGAKICFAIPARRSTD